MSSIPGQVEFATPLLGFAAYSGTGKTTLLLKLLPILKASGLRVGMVKHAHHDFEIDHPGKDSYELRAAGADEMLIAGGHQVAWIHERQAPMQEPTLEETLALLDPEILDLVLVEGFKAAAFPKIELHRPALGRPLIFPHDPHVVAIATDVPLQQQIDTPPRLGLNDPQQIAAFVMQFCGLGEPLDQGMRA